LRKAEENLIESLILSYEAEDEFLTAVGQQELGRVLAYCGRWIEAQHYLTLALNIFKKQHENWGDIQSVRSHSIIFARHALLKLLQSRNYIDSEYHNGLLREAYKYAKRALSWANKHAQHFYPVKRDFIRARWLLGTSEALLGYVNDADKHLNKALQDARSIELVEMEVNLLLALSQMWIVKNQQNKSLQLTEEALAISKQAGYRLQQADAHLFLARLAREGHLLLQDREAGLTPEAAARKHAEAARQAAAGEDGPPYHYKVAYDEAERLLRELDRK